MTDLPIFSFGATDVGGRKTNEDAFQTGEQRETAKIVGRGHLYVVADGTGGQEGGRTASAWAAEIVVENYYDNASPDLGESLRTAIQSAHRALFRLAEEVSTWKNMSTTLVAAVVKGNDLWVAHVGDSRLYLVRDNKVQQLTQDHTWQEDDENYGSLTRWLGGGDQPAIEVDLRHETLRDGDVVLLCTDGLYSQVSKDEMIDLPRRMGVKATAQQLIALAKARGTSDNTTAIAIRVGGSAVEAAPKRRQLILIGGGIAAALALILAVILLGSNNSNTSNPVISVDKPTSTSAPVRVINTLDSMEAATATPEASSAPGAIGPTSTRRPTLTPTATRPAPPTTAPGQPTRVATTATGGEAQPTTPSCPTGKFWDPVMNQCRNEPGSGGPPPTVAH